MTANVWPLTGKEDHILVRRIDDLVRLTPLASLAGMFAALALAILLVDGDNALVGIGWLAVAVTVNLARLFVLQMVDEGLPEIMRARQLMSGFLVIGLANSLTFAIGLPLLLDSATGLEAAVAFLIVGGLLAGLIVASRGAPAIVRGFILLASIGAGIAAYRIGGELAVPMMIVLLAQAGILLQLVRSQEAFFLDRIVQEHARRESDATVRILLNEYEENSSDWLWTADDDGFLQAVSERFGSASGRGAAEIEGLALAELFDAGPERDRLSAALWQREPFRDLTVPLHVAGSLRYWALSAMPQHDGRISGFARDVTDARMARDQIKEMAHYDGLTGLANRNLFLHQLREALKSDNPAERVALFTLDLDNFKSVNDTQGHGVGDRLLRNIAERLAGSMRKGDIIARLGGDEFAVLFELKAQDRLLARRTHQLTEALRGPFDLGGQEYRVTASVGVARCAPGECDAEELMRRADLALYAAKARGRDGFALFEPALDEAARNRRSIETDLRKAIRRRELEVHYQPIVDLDRGQVIGHEALVRWRHPQRGMILPDAFIGIAEESGLIVPLGEWIIAEAMREVAGWGGDTQLAINLSPVQMRSANLIPAITSALESSGIAPDRVEFEITESALMRNSEANRAVLLKLRELGIRIALDDFGTGYSSLSYLRSFPFDKIKIDKCFVDDVVEQADSQAIIAAVTRLAAAMGMRTTAEGVERIDQLDMLRKLGCTEAQGFLIARPVQGSELDDEEAELALPTPLPPEIIDYRKARRAALRRRKAKKSAGKLPGVRAGKDARRA
ncbi:putative bifunctional diguanylate cyclase/phosphodiesterase [Altererythrobacter sp. MF3-039]|uniref:putative bifunctional diguanylate cyclase/phosphodiesterase n=1 Tax=Altererythrobacter sp. MF3-039 TaxID=3252901 RepID=UPI00390C4D15